MISENDSALPVRLFDRRLVRARRASAARSSTAAFLHELAATEIGERLTGIQRNFAVTALFGDRHSLIGRAAAGSGRIDTLIDCVGSIPPQVTAGSRVVACDEELLPFACTSLDCIISALTLHWVNDLPGTLIQARRALKPDGLFLAVLLGGLTLTELRDSMLAAESEITGGAAQRISPFADIRDLGALLQRAGFALPVVDADTITVRYDNAFDLMSEIRAMGESNAMVKRYPLRRDTLMRAVEIYAERYSDGDGRIRATFQFIHLIGWAPHESQQKPLAPGSAQVRLADALNTREHTIQDNLRPALRRKRDR